MEDVAPALYKRIQRLYNSAVNSDEKIAALLKKEKRTFFDAEDYAALKGKHAAKAMGTILKPEALPDGKMYFNIAQRTVRPMLEMLSEDVTDYGVATMEALNKAAGIGIKAQRPKVSENRIIGIIDRLSNAEEFEDIEWILKSPTENFALNAVTEIVKLNAEFQQNAGLHPTITRTARFKCCDWCGNLEGQYDYPISDNSIYQRHENCRCSVTFDPGDGRKQDVWSKSWR